MVKFILASHWLFYRMTYFFWWLFALSRFYSKMSERSFDFLVPQATRDRGSTHTASARRWEGDRFESRAGTAS